MPAGRTLGHILYFIHLDSVLADGRIDFTLIMCGFFFCVIVIENVLKYQWLFVFESQ